MGIYIKGMDMPKDCSECGLIFKVGNDVVCKITKSNINVIAALYKRMTDCPLVPAPTVIESEE